jgi:hypothetical protein
MSLPPEQINIKRRREEEPVETLCKYIYTSDPHVCLGIRCDRSMHCPGPQDRQSCYDLLNQSH